MPPKRPRGWLPPRLFNRLFRLVPRLCVDAAIRGPRGWVLAKRGIPPWKGRWHFPGGAVRVRERLAQAVERKALEETGLRVRTGRLLGVFDDPRNDPRGHAVVLFYEARPLGGELRPDCAWFRRRPRGVGFPRLVRKELRAAGLR
jgi:8-oxo-dGTP diphosphatase